MALESGPPAATLVFIMQLEDSQQQQQKSALCRTPTWPNASTSCQDFRAHTMPRCNGCASSATAGASHYGNGGAGENDRAIGAIEGGAASCGTLDTLGSGHTCSGHGCSGHYATADAQFKRWKYYFEEYDRTGGSEILLDDFRKLLKMSEFQRDVGPGKLEVLRTRAADVERITISYHEFLAIMSTKRSRSFTIAVHWKDREVWSDHDYPLPAPPRNRCFMKMVRRIAKEFLVDERDRQYYADHYTCCPPPLFMPAVTLLEIGFFIYYTTVDKERMTSNGPVPADSVFIYRPDKRLEIWRFFFYIFIHAGWVHLFFNMLVQLIVGVPLEMVHGSLRIGAIYMAGVLAGSLGTSVFDMDAFLVGASGGVYALLAAHLANILLNYSEMELGILKLAAVFIIASADVGFAIWDRYTNVHNGQHPPVGYVAHLMGALAGLTIGLLVLKNFEQKLHSQIMWWIALGIYSACTIFAILWNIFYY